MSKKKKPSGGAAIYAAGKTPLQLALTAEEKQFIRVAAATEGLSMAAFLLRHGLAAARKTLGKT